MSKCSVCGVEVDLLGCREAVCSPACLTRLLANPGKTSATGKSSSRRARGGRRADLGNRYFRSRWEANWARYLDLLVGQGEILSWYYEIDTFHFPVLRGTRSYTPDFRVHNQDGAVAYHEIKGWMSPRCRTQLRRMRKYHPDVPVLLIDRDAYYDVARRISAVIANWEKG